MWTILSTASKGDYIYARVPDHPNATKHGYVLEHRIVVENALGRLLTTNEVVHHRDENKKNNHLDNLEVLTRSAHSKHHAMKPKFYWPSCAECGVVFLRRYNQRPGTKGYVNTFCTRSCAGKFNRRLQLAPS